MRASVPVGVRVIRACGVLVALVVAACLLECSLQARRPGAFSEAIGISAASFFTNGEGAFDGLGGEGVPQGFGEEVLSLSGRHDVRVGAGGRVVSFTSEANAETEFAVVSEALEDRGWTPVESGIDRGGSFVKGEGDYVWAFVSCVETGAGTSVVINCMTAEGRG